MRARSTRAPTTRARSTPARGTRGPSTRRGLARGATRPARFVVGTNNPAHLRITETGDLPESRRPLDRHFARGNEEDMKTIFRSACMACTVSLASALGTGCVVHERSYSEAAPPPPPPAQPPPPVAAPAAPAAPAA